MATVTYTGFYAVLNTYVVEKILNGFTYGAQYPPVVREILTSYSKKCLMKTLSNSRIKSTKVQGLLQCGLSESVSLGTLLLDL